MQSSNLVIPNKMHILTVFGALIFTRFVFGVIVYYFESMGHSSQTDLTEMSINLIWLGCAATLIGSNFLFRSVFKKENYKGKSEVEISNKMLSSLMISWIVCQVSALIGVVCYLFYGLFYEQALGMIGLSLLVGLFQKPNFSRMEEVGGFKFP